MKTCKRFNKDGSRCTNTTDNADGWCREPECGGYLRASFDKSPQLTEPTQPHRPDRKRNNIIEDSGLDVEDVSYVHITGKAVDSFRYHHGGTAQAAETELRIMLEDFILKGKGRESKSGYLTLGLRGYGITLSPNRDSMVNYTTVHAERTWSQVKAGVPSRSPRKKRKRAERIKLPSFGVAPTETSGSKQWKTVEECRELVSPTTVYISAVAVTNYGRVHKLLEPNLHDLESQMRTELGLSLQNGSIAQTTNIDDQERIAVEHNGFLWTLNPELTTVTTYKKATTESE